MQCRQCKFKSKASFSFADLVSFIVSLFSTSLLKSVLCRDLGKKSRLCKFADNTKEIQITNSETKRSTKFQVAPKSCDLRIAHRWPKGLRKHSHWSSDSTQNFEEGQAVVPPFSCIHYSPLPKGFCVAHVSLSLCLWYARQYSKDFSYVFHLNFTKSC